MANSNEFAEFETDEATFDAMLEAAEPAELFPPPAHVTVLSAARDTITFAHGLPVTISAATSAAAWGIQQSPIRVQPIRQDRHVEQVAG